MYPLGDRATIRNQSRPTSGRVAPQAPQQPSNVMSIQSGVNGNPNYNTSIDASGFTEAANSAWENAKNMFGGGSRPSGGGGSYGGGITVNGGGPIDVTTQEVENNQLMSYQLDKLLDENNAYMQRARQSGLDLAHQRGLGNSSIAAGNAMAAAIDRAAPIAGFDASRYGRVGDMNMDAKNRASLQSSAQAASAANAAASRAHASAMQKAAHQNAMQGMMFGHGLGGVDDFRRHVLNMENREDDQAFRAGQADIDRFMQQNQFDQNMGLNWSQFGFDQQRFGADDAYRNRALDADIFQSFQNPAMAERQMIYSNPNMTAEERAGALSNSRQEWPQMWNEISNNIPQGLMSGRSFQAASNLPPMRRFRP